MGKNAKRRRESVATARQVGATGTATGINRRNRRHPITDRRDSPSIQDDMSYELKALDAEAFAAAWAAVGAGVGDPL